MRKQIFDPLTMPLTGTRLIEASAGTGKTFSLAGLYLRLLVAETLSVQDILVLTFTRAATKELRERIRQRLVDAARVARDPAAADADSAEDQFVQAVIAASDENPQAIARKLADAANRMDEATITTIHGFTQRAAADNAFTSALPFDRGEQVADRVVNDEAVADYWRSKALGKNALPGFSDWWPTPDKLSSDMSAFWSRPHARLAGPSTEKIIGLAEKVRKLWGESGEEFLVAIHECWESGGLRQTKSDLYPRINALGGIEQAIKALIASLETGNTIPALPAWLGALENPAIQFKQKHEHLGEALFAMPLAQQLCEFQPLARLAALRNALDTVDEMAATRKLVRRQFSYADMIIALHTAITDEDTGAGLADALHTTWPFALVDEFQDTDPLQYEILRRIYGGRDTGGLTLIGDPKQAIYGFRGGDVFAYLHAANDAGEQTYTLDTNYRATQALLDGVEALFRMPGEDAFLVDGIDYQTVKAGRKANRQVIVRGKPLSAMTLWTLGGDASNKKDAQYRCHAATVAQIGHLLDPGNAAVIRKTGDADSAAEDTALAPRDIAVLVNTNQQAADMQHALSLAGIPAVCLHQSSIYASAEALDVLHFLNAAANPTDESLLRGALVTTLFDNRLSDLIEMQDGQARFQAEVRHIQRAHEKWRDHGVLAMLSGQIQHTGERLLHYADGERRISNYLQLAELLARAESETFGPAGLLRWLKQSIQQAGDGETGETEQLRLESDEALVRITTVHKAKGLEYPIVFVPYAPWLGTMGKPHKPPYELHDDAHTALIDVVGDNRNRDPSIREARAQGLRVLYVALTRAEFACFMPWCAAGGTPNSALASLLHRDTVGAPTSWVEPQAKLKFNNDEAKQRLDALANRAPDAMAVLPLPDRSTSDTAPPVATPELTEARTDLPQAREPWSVYSFTRIVKAAGPGPAAPGANDEDKSLAAAAPEPTDQDPTEQQRLPDLPGGANFGSAVHALLEFMDIGQWPTAGQPLPTSHHNAIASTLRRYGVVIAQGKDGEAIIAHTADMIGNALHTPLPHIGPLAALQAHQRTNEMEFSLRLGGNTVGAMLDLLNESGYATQLPNERKHDILRGLMHGFIDLTLEHEGRYYVLDYKTNWLGPHTGDYDPPGLESAIKKHHYDLQYLIYVTALHRYLRTRLNDYDPARHLGGVYYLFLRGMAPAAGTRGVYFDRPDHKFIQQLDTLLDQQAHAA